MSWPIHFSRLQIYRSKHLGSNQETHYKLLFFSSPELKGPFKSRKGENDFVSLNAIVYVNIFFD